MDQADYLLYLNWARVLYSVAGLFIGFIIGAFTTKWMYKHVFKVYRDEMHSQYTKILNDFGLYKKADGRWYKDET